MLSTVAVVMVLCMQAVAFILRKHPNCLTYGMSSLQGRLQTLLDVGLNEQDLEVVVRRVPNIWRTSAKSMQNTARCLKDTVGFTTEELHALIVKEPYIIVTSKVHHMVPFLQYLPDCEVYAGILRIRWKAVRMCLLAVPGYTSTASRAHISGIKISFAGEGMLCK